MRSPGRLSPGSGQAHSDSEICATSDRILFHFSCNLRLAYVDDEASNGRGDAILRPTLLATLPREAIIDPEVNCTIDFVASP